MAVYFDSAADVIGADSGAAISGNVESRTICGLARVESNTGSTQVLCGVSDSLAYLSCGLYWRGTANNMYIVSYDSGGNDSFLFPSRPAIGELFFWYLKCSGTGTDQLEGGWGYLDGSAMVSTTGTLRSGSDGPCAIVFLGGIVSLDCRSQMAAVRQWTTPLTANELENERYTIYPSKYANLIGAYPMWDVATSLTDFSGNGATLTNLSGFGGGAPSDTDVSFPVRVRPRRSGRAVFAPAGGGGGPVPKLAAFGGKIMSSGGKLLRIA